MFARAAKSWQRWGAGVGAVTATYLAAPLAASEPGSDPAFTKEAVLRHPRILVHDLMAGEGKIMVDLFGIDPVPARRKLSNMLVFAGTSVPDLAQDVAYELDASLGRINVSRFADGEVGIQVEESVRGKDIYVVQSTSQPANENLMELLLSIAALRRASAGKITAVIPYYGYLRDVGTVSTLTHQLRAEVLERLDAEVMDSMRQQRAQADADAIAAAGGLTAHGGLPAISPSDLPLLQDLPPPPLPQEDWGRVSHYPISAADVAKMLETAGCDRVISVDLQPPGSAQIEGFFDMPVENLRATPICVEHLSKLRLQQPVIVAPNEACIQLAHDVAAGLQQKQGCHVGFAVTLEGGPSRGTDRYVHRGPPVLPSPAGEEPPIELVGDVRGCDVVIVDEMIDTAGTLMRRVKLLKDRGARRVVAFATHGLFNGAALQRITRSPLSEVIVTNTVPLRDDVDVRHTHKIVQLSVAPILAEAILRVQMELSLQMLRSAGSEKTLFPRYQGQE